MRVYVRNTTRRYAVNLRTLKRAAHDIVAAVAPAQASVSLSLVGDAAIRRLNRDYRGKDRTTDVLSFGTGRSLSRRKGGRGRAREHPLGDVVISVDTARRQAAAYGATLEAELRRLLIHGVLHLMGHDHERAGDAARMRAQERRLARLIGLPWPY